MSGQFTHLTKRDLNVLTASSIGMHLLQKGNVSGFMILEEGEKDLRNFWEEKENLLLEELQKTLPYLERMRCRMQKEFLAKGYILGETRVKYERAIGDAAELRSCICIENGERIYRGILKREDNFPSKKLEKISA